MTGSDQEQTLSHTARGVREQRGLGLRETARLAGISASHLSMFERGRAGMSVPALRRLAIVLGRSDIAEFLSDVDREPAA